MTGKERQRAYRERMVAAGCVQVNVWVPAGSVAEIVRAAEIMREQPARGLQVARLVDPATGRLVGLRKSIPAKVEGV